jgi:hypothetical protein
MFICAIIGILLEIHTCKLFYAKKFGKFTFIIWSGIWLSIIALCLLPETVKYFLTPTLFFRLVDVIIVGLIVSLYIILFRLFLITEDINLNLSKLKKFEKGIKSPKL